MLALGVLALAVVFGVIVGLTSKDNPIADAVVIWFIAGEVFLALCLVAAPR
nr:MAG TPA: hypothetical protein [Caudoviricetes sp.]